MAETKVGRGGAKRSSRRSNGSRAKPQGSRKRANGSGSKSGSQSRTKAKAKGAQDRPKPPASSPHETAPRGRGPAIAGGAVLAAIAAGGIAISRNGHGKGRVLPGIGKKRRGISMPKVSRPKLSTPDLPKPNFKKLTVGGGESTGKALKATAKALNDTAVEVGKAGYRVGELASEVRRVREQAQED